MSMHKTHSHLAALNAGLAAHRLPSDTPSQLSDCFRSGYLYAERTASTDEMQEWLAAMTSVSWDKTTPELRDAVNSLLHALARARVGTAARLELALVGIDKTSAEHKDGWWETSVGAKFGAERLREALDITTSRPSAFPMGAAGIGLGYARDALARHDAYYQRHPSTETARQGILEDCALLEAAACLEELGTTWVARLLAAAESLTTARNADELSERAAAVSQHLKDMAGGQTPRGPASNSSVTERPLNDPDTSLDNAKDLK